MPEENDTLEPGGETPRGDKPARLDVLGVQLEVSNPRLAELLAQETAAPLTTEPDPERTAEDIRDLRGTFDEALPEAVLAPPTLKDEQDEARRREFRAMVMEAAADLGFDATPDGVWHSPTGASIVTRAVDRPVTLAAAVHFADEVGARRVQIGGPDSSVLFIVEGEASAEAFKSAIRQRRQHDVMRVISIDDLHEIRQWGSTSAIDHEQALVLLYPGQTIDVGEVVAMIRRGPRTQGQP